VEIVRTGLTRSTIDKASGDVLIQLAADAATALSEAVP